MFSFVFMLCISTPCLNVLFFLQMLFFTVLVETMKPGSCSTFSSIILMIGVQ